MRKISFIEVKEILMKIFCFLFILTFVACQFEISEKTIFKGELSKVEKSPQFENIIGEKIRIAEPFAGFPFVYDSLLFFTHPKYRDYSIYCININSGRLHAKYIKKGRGPNEFRNTTPFFQILKNKKGESVSPFMAINEKMYGIFNLDKSIETKQTVFDTIYKEKWDEKCLLPFTYTFSLGNNLVLARNDAAKQFGNEEKYSAPKYLKFSSNTNKPDEEYNIYNEYYNENLGELNMAALASTDRIRPDKKKLAMAMNGVNQLNILDIENGKLKGFLTSGSKGIEDLNKIVDKEKFPFINKCMEVDQNNIYVLNVVQQNGNDNIFENLASNTVNVFDWNGNLVRRIKLSNNIEFFTMDAKRKLLYGVNTAEEAIYRFKL